MYGDQVQDIILERMLKRVGAKFDKREGSIIWDALAPAAVEFENFFYALAAVLDEVFADTATRKYLIKRCAERGITPKPASYAIVHGEFTPTNLEIPIGTRYSHEDLNYFVTEKISDGLYKLQCETIGSIANGQTGRLIPIDHINGLETANIIDVIVPGEDEEDTEALRARYFDSLKSEAFGGNKKDYRDKVLAINGVGGCKIYSGSEWNGGGTVLIVVQDSDMGSPIDDFIKDIQEELDPEMNAGEGVGIAPIGHFVTVVPVNKESINVQFSIDYETGASWETVGVAVTNAVKEYLLSLNENWQNKDHIVVRIAHLESVVLDIPGVLDIRNTIINDTESNYSLDKNSIVEVGVVNGN